ncbi:MAG TPA: small acid-soluble spore protein Tlp [Oscillospiraceae bacterium]|mgnify:CR=1 FL=1|nr:small acid-soluble spore protein Tlp [Oscillospiraceae bacterium]HPF56861.1 small acid-soluble spore protein Tlp [Clostridiales bacterium]HPK36323.1 small acid-soluble spore protein Tlp [Oscillospiraceae bacterium]HPR76095.1 small acid-soluble spore protein Tlp [Oscillospiraceae bacterium]
MKNKPDDRSDNAAKIQRNINHTLFNMEAARDMMAKTDNLNTKKELEEKNKRRETALKDMRKEIRDESKNSQKGYGE